MTNKPLLNLKENKQYQLIVENSVELITTLDLNRKIVYISPACFNILGYTREELVGLDVTAYAHPDDKERMISAFNNAIKHNMIQPEIFRIRHKDGSWKYLEILEGISLIESAKPYGIVAFAWDVTKRIENQGKKDSFINFLSHELKTPLTTILMLMSFFEKKIPNIQLSPYYSQLKKQIAQFSQLVQTLVDVTDMESGTLHLNKEKMLLGDCIKEVVSYQLKGSNNIIINNGEHEKVFADKKRLEEVMNALILNAIKYSDVHKPIMISVYKNERQVEVGIKDQGSGIPKNEQEKIFEKYYQSGDQKQYVRPGLGIGLYFARELIKMHQGKLWVKSEQGEGSTFYFSLPLQS